MRHKPIVSKGGVGGSRSRAHSMATVTVIQYTHPLFRPHFDPALKNQYNFIIHHCRITFFPHFCFLCYRDRVCKTIWISDINPSHPSLPSSLPFSPICKKSITMAEFVICKLILIADISSQLRHCTSKCVQETISK